MALRVAVAGALGRMGRLACTTIAAAADLELVGAIARSNVGHDLAAVLGTTSPSGAIHADLASLRASAQPDVLVDFTLFPASRDLAFAAVESGIAPVIGVSGWGDDDLSALADRCARSATGAAFIPNFAVGAVLMMRYAAAAARYFPTAEIIELHHDGKRDKPSGTAKATAARIARATGRPEVPIHSVRLRGLVAHQAVLFGGEGEILTLRHDSTSRESFAGGILLAVRRVRGCTGLVIGLDAFLEE
ncbi:MAG: 4-hydroxy-tetrahydrodipicolinate reductase [Vulcanimicrobiaceae bacterium]